MRKRKNGEGCYGEKNIKGIKYKFYIAPNKAWTVYAKTAKELEIKRKERERKDKEVVVDQIMVFSDLCDKWLESIYKTVSPGTYDAYENVINYRIKQDKGFDIGNIQAAQLFPEMVEQYFAKLAQLYSKGTIDKTWTVVNQTILFGQKNNYIPADRSFKDVKKPNEESVAVKKKIIDFITFEDMEELYKESVRLTSRNTPVYGNASKILVFIMYSGLRIGEAIGLKWQNVGHDFCTIRVVQSGTRVVDRDSNGNAIKKDNHVTYKNLQKKTKTESGEREIPLPSRAVEILKYFDETFPDHKDTDNVFLTENGNIYNKRSIERTLTTILKNSACKCKTYTPHSLRHGYGSVLLSKGIDIKVVSVLLGHKDISTTYNIYIHILEDDKKNAVKSVFDKT